MGKQAEEQQKFGERVGPKFFSILFSSRVMWFWFMQSGLLFSASLVTGINGP